MKKKKNKALTYEFEKGFKDPIVNVTEFPKHGLWVPVSISAVLAGITPQMIRYLIKNEVIGVIKFKKGPILINHKDVLKKWVNL